MENTTQDLARVCYQAEREYNRTRGRVDQLNWSDLNEVARADLVDKLTVIRKSLYRQDQLSPQMQIWAALIQVLGPTEHVQD